MARGMVCRQKLLMIDEPSLRLTPGLVVDMFDKIAEINRETSVNLLLMEQKMTDVLAICGKVYSLKVGKEFFSDASDEPSQQKPD